MCSSIPILKFCHCDVFKNYFLLSWSVRFRWYSLLARRIEVDGDPYKLYWYILSSCIYMNIQNENITSNINICKYLQRKYVQYIAVVVENKMGMKTIANLSTLFDVWNQESWCCGLCGLRIMLPWTPTSGKAVEQSDLIPEFACNCSAVIIFGSLSDKQISGASIGGCLSFDHSGITTSILVLVSVDHVTAYYFHYNAKLKNFSPLIFLCIVFPAPGNKRIDAYSRIARTT